MNNFKKLLASAMALSMVASVVPVTGVNAAFNLNDIVGSDGEINSNVEAYNLVKAVTDSLTAAGLTKETITPENSEIKIGNEEDTKLLTNASGVFSLDATLEKQLKKVQNYAYATDETFITAKYLLDLPTALTAMVGNANGSWSNLYVRTDAFLNTAGKFRNDILTPSSYVEATALMEEFEKYVSFETNLPSTHEDGEWYSSEEYLDVKAELQDAIDQYVAENYGDELDGYLTQLEKFYEAFILNEGYDTDGLTKADLDRVVKQIKEGAVGESYNGVKTDKITKANYKAFGSSESVEAIMNQFDALYESIEEVKDAISKKNDAYVEYTKKQFSGKSVRDIVNYDYTASKGDDNFWNVYFNLTDAQWEIMKAYKEEVFDVVYTLEAKEVGNVYVEKSERVATVSDSAAATVIDNLTPTDMDSEYGIFTIYDKEDGTRYWDLLEAHMEGLSSALKAVTDDIAGLTPATIKGSDRELLEAAEDAIYELTTNYDIANATGGYADNLTSAQQRVVKQADTKITNLREAFDNLGIVDVNDKDWWQYENGQWVFYQDGKTVSNVWVADINNNWFYAGANGVMLTNSWIARDSSLQVWYYVGADGKMVTNTVVDGCTIDANGEWHA